MDYNFLILWHAFVTKGAVCIRSFFIRSIKDILKIDFGNLWVNKIELTEYYNVCGTTNPVLIPIQTT